MTLFLRTKENKDIFSIDIWKELEYYDNNDVKRRYVEMSAFINVANYSNLLIKFASQYIYDKFNNKEKTIEINDFIYQMDYLSEIRGWMWESYFSNKKNDGDDKDIIYIIELVREKMDNVANKFNLIVVED